ncbi:MAG: hypothetical protein KDD85_07295 [Parvularculaceae bacterium]|nr:hypothetical protein [Parvularculaceae bacterium]
MKGTALAGVVLLAASAANAQEAGANGAKPAPCSDPVFRQFDFWVGEWDVFLPDGKRAGSNSIGKEEYGCLLVERWKNAQGVTGQSYNFVDLETGKWRQVWVSAGSTIDYEGGLDDSGAMVLEGTIGYGAGKPGNGARFRGTWTPNADGSVTQRFEQYDAGENEWTDWFTGIYRRKAKPD